VWREVQAARARAIPVLGAAGRGWDSEDGGVDGVLMGRWPRSVCMAACFLMDKEGVRWEGVRGGEGGETGGKKEAGMGKRRWCAWVGGCLVRSAGLARP
jgi:hypothetical protein